MLPNEYNRYLLYLIYIYLYHIYSNMYSNRCNLHIDMRLQYKPEVT